jgi:hypothetical protein
MPDFTGKPPIDWKLMERCRSVVTALMVAAGWNHEAGKFSGVMKKKADKMYRELRGKK